MMKKERFASLISILFDDICNADSIATIQVVLAPGWNHFGLEFGLVFDTT